MCGDIVLYYSTELRGMLCECYANAECENSVAPARVSWPHFSFVSAILIAILYYQGAAQFTPLTFSPLGKIRAKT